jgi:hypothetical protein
MSPFSLRWLFVAMSLLVVLLAIWLGLESKAARTQKEVVDMVLAKGGEVFYRHQEMAPYSWDDSEPNAPQWLRRSLGDDYFQTVSAIFLDGPKFTDEDLKAIAKLRGLRMLGIDPECAVTPAGLRKIQSELPNCEID